MNNDGNRRDLISALELAKNIIFDFDGVLADSEFFQLKIWRELILEKKYAVSEFPIYAIAGIDDRIAIENLVPGLEPPAYDYLVAEKQRRCRARAQEVTPVDSALELLTFLNSSKRLYICSNSRAVEIHQFVQYNFPAIKFNLIIGKGDFVREKPDPAPYLKMLESAKISVAGSLVFEDSTAGVQSAQAAGLNVIYLNRYGIRLPNVNSILSFREIIR
ncbi:MAG: HAD family phosphatase [Calditrichaeota bacterium]|nr:MAG: HAD family phosphatase [Calditrichota bacterium]